MCKNGQSCEFRHESKHGKQNKKDITCFRCSKQGHRQAECPEPEVPAEANAIIFLEEADPLTDDTKIPMTYATIGDEKVTVKWDSWCMGIEGQISSEMAEKLIQAGHGKFTKLRKDIRYGNGSVTPSYGTLETAILLEDEENSTQASIPVKFQVIKGNCSILVGYRIIQAHNIRITEDPRSVLLPTEQGVLRFAKLTVDEWKASEILYASRRRQCENVLYQIESEFQTKDAIFDCSPTC